MTSKKSNYKFLLKGTLTTAGTTVAISNDLELDQEVTFTNASVVLRNRTWSVIERTKATATGGVLTFLKRWLEQGDTEVEDSDLKKERRDGTVGYVTMLAPQLLDRLEYTEFYNGITGWDYADAAARDAALWWDWVALHPYVWVFVQDEWVHYNYNTSTGQWEAVETWTVTPNASPTVAGKVELATDAEVTAWTNTGSSWPLVVQPSQLLHEIDVSSFDEVTPVTTDEIRVNRAWVKKKITTWALLEAPIRWDASDWSVTISTNTTLTRDMYYNVLTVNSWVTLNTGSFRIFANSVINNGTIERNGNNWGNATGTAGTPWTWWAWLSVWSIGWSASGWNWASWSHWWQPSNHPWLPWVAITSITWTNWWAWWNWASSTWGQTSVWWAWWVNTAQDYFFGLNTVQRATATWEILFSTLYHASRVTGSTPYTIVLNWWAWWAWGGSFDWNIGYRVWWWWWGSGWWIVYIQARTITNNGTIRANWWAWGQWGYVSPTFWWSGRWAWWGGWWWGGWLLFLIYSDLVQGTLQANWWTAWVWWNGTNWNPWVAWVAWKIVRIKV